MGLHKSNIHVHVQFAIPARRTTSAVPWRHIEEGANYKSNINPTMWNEPQI